jgi:hypothetical protein
MGLIRAKQKGAGDRDVGDITAHITAMQPVRDILTLLRERGYQTCSNAILRTHMQARRAEYVKILGG